MLRFYTYSGIIVLCYTTDYSKLLLEGLETAEAAHQPCEAGLVRENDESSNAEIGVVD